MVCTKSKAKHRIFFWNKDNSAKSANLIGWHKVCQPKKFGGVGIRKAKVNNVALQLKLIWKLLSSPENIWVKLVWKKYVFNDDLFSTRVPPSASWQWKNLMAHRKKIRQGLRWIIGNGQDIKF